MAAQWIGPEAAQGVIHEFSGWIVFVFSFALILAIQKLIVKFAPRPRSVGGFVMSLRARVAIIVACLLAAYVPVARADRAEDTPMRMSFALFPMQLGEWQGRQNPPFADSVLAVLGLDDYLTRLYQRNDAYADLYVGYWKSQRQGDTMHSPQNCLPGAGWEPISDSLLTFADPRNPSGPALSVNRYVIQKGLEQTARSVLVSGPRAHHRQRVLEQDLPGARRRAP